jgi:integrase
MPRKLERALTPRKIQTAGPGMHADGGNLYLEITEAKNGGLNKSWIFRFGVPRPDGKTRYRDLGMGSLSTLTLSEARERARLLRIKRLDGIDPIEERRTQRAAVPPRLVTFDEVADQWLSVKGVEWPASYARAQTQRLRDYASPIIGKLPVRTVTVEHVTTILDRLWKSHPNTASLLRAQVERVLDMARAKGLRDAENPARLANLKHVYATTAKLRKAKRASAGKGEHHAAMSYKQVGAFMGELRALPDDIAAWALEFCILTAARTGEVVHARWDEIDLAERTWTIPAERMKARKEHRVPLADRAIAILKKAAEVRTGDRVFPVTDAAMLRLLHGRRPHLTTHGFRSTFRDWAGESTAFPREVAEHALAHSLPDKVEAAYARSDLFERRRKLMSAWSAFCARPLAEAKVLPLARAAR